MHYIKLILRYKIPIILMLIAASIMSYMLLSELELFEDSQTASAFSDQTTEPTKIKYEVGEYLPHTYSLEGDILGFDPYLTSVDFSKGNYDLECTMDSWK